MSLMYLLNLLIDHYLVISCDDAKFGNGSVEFDFLSYTFPMQVTAQ